MSHGQAHRQESTPNFSAHQTFSGLEAGPMPLWLRAIRILPNELGTPSEWPRPVGLNSGGAATGKGSVAGEERELSRFASPLKKGQGRDSGSVRSSSLEPTFGQFENQTWRKR